MEETKEEKVEYKIYQIVCKETGEVYFGKTTKTLQHRLYQHKNDLNCTSRQIILRGDYYIEQINSTFDEEESIRLERRYIETFECVNGIIPGRTRKEYYEENKDEILEKNKEWNKAHKEEMSEYNKEYREAHKEEISEYHKEWYEEHKEELSKKRKEKYTCECGSTIRKADKPRHERSQKHIDYINSKK
jgi:hypothetical protein